MVEKTGFVSTPQKPLVCLLFSGQARSSPFAEKKERKEDKENDSAPSPPARILESYRRFLLSSTFEKNYRYIVFVSTDECDTQSIVDFFGMDNIGNVHTFNNDEYLYKIQNKIPSVDFFLDRYNQQNFGLYTPYPGSVHQYYKVLDCFNLFRNSEWYQKTDYIARVRMDTMFKTSVYDALTTLQDDPKLHILVHWDFFALGKPEIMEMYCTTVEHGFGTYTNKIKVPDEPPIMVDYNSIEMGRWMYAPERQLFEAIFEWCNNQQLDVFEAINYTKSEVEILRLQHQNNHNHCEKVCEESEPEKALEVVTSPTHCDPEPEKPLEDVAGPVHCEPDEIVFCPDDEKSGVEEEKQSLVFQTVDTEQDTSEPTTKKKKAHVAQPIAGAVLLLVATLLGTTAVHFRWKSKNKKKTKSNEIWDDTEQNYNANNYKQRLYLFTFVIVLLLAAVGVSLILVSVVQFESDRNE